MGQALLTLAMLLVVLEEEGAKPAPEELDVAQLVPQWLVQAACVECQAQLPHHGLHIALKLVQLGAIYEAYLGHTSNFNVFANVPALKILQFKAYYARINIEGLEDLLVFDDRSSAVAQARYELFKSVYLVARASRRWTFDGESNTYTPTDEWNFGAEYSLSF